MTLSIFLGVVVFDSSSCIEARPLCLFLQITRVEFCISTSQARIDSCNVAFKHFIYLFLIIDFDRYSFCKFC